MDVEDVLRAVGPVILAALAAWVVDHMTARRGLQPPGFAASWRRLAACGVLGLIFYVAVFLPLGRIGLGMSTDFAALHPIELFGLHLLLVLVLVVWYLLGFAGTPDAARRWISQFGYRTARPGWELGLGVLAGLAAWAVVISALLGIAGLLYLVGAEKSLPQTPPAAIPWMASQPLWLKIGLVLSAGLVEESFFRGFLQPRAGIALSTVFFAMAHLSYDQPFMLVGVSLLSLLFAFIVRWRQSVWAAVAAHTVFDAVQLLVVIPFALKFMPQAGGP
jgi:membrane protease YdiL (CAAX protease family)